MKVRTTMLVYLSRIRGVILATMSFPANFDNAKNEETSMFEKRKVKRKKIDYMRYIKFKND